jgi:photosystem II stability/assembly factor-like uncharacterized protein
MPAPINAYGLTAFGDSIIASCDGILHVAGGDGRAWRSLHAGVTGGVVSAFDGTRLYLAGGNDGLSVRDPGDEDFHVCNTGIFPVNGLRIVGDTLWLHTDDTLYASVDRGRSFTARSGVSMRALLFGDGIALYALFNQDSLRRSEDGGRTWIPCASPFPYDRGGKDTYALHRGVLYASIPDVRGLSRSTDQGRSWRQIPDLPVGDPDRFYHPGVTALAANDEQLLICTVRGIHRSTDDGRSWEALSTASTRMYQLFIGPECLLANNSGGLYRYDEASHAWRQIVFSRWSQYGTSLNAAGRYLFGESSRISNDEGESWWAEESPNALAAQPDGTLLRVFTGTRDSSSLERSMDDGKSWTFLDSIPPVTYELAANATRLLHGAQRWLPLGYIWTLRTSTDDGASWSELLTLPVALSAPRTLAINRRGDILFFSLPHSVFSSNGGGSWDTLRTPMGDSLFAAVLTERGLFLQSESGIWQRQADGSMLDTRLTERFDGARIVGKWEDHVCLLGRDSLYFLHDIDGRLPAVAIPDMLVGLSYAPRFASSTSCVFLSSGRNTIFRLRLQGILDASPPAAVPGGTTILSVHPHPARDRISVRVAFANSGYSDVDIIDMLGRVRARIQGRFLEAGTHDLHFDLSGFEPGQYLLRMCSGTDIRVHSIIVGG